MYLEWRGGGATNGDEIRNNWECRQTMLDLRSHFKELDFDHEREEKPLETFNLHIRALGRKQKNLLSS